MANESKTVPASGPQKIEIDHVMPGADVIQVGEEQLALGFPEEVVKAWLKSGKKVSAWLVPDLRCHQGIVQWAFEFPLYYALFLQGAFAKGKKIPVLVHPSDWPDLLTYLRLTLLGLSAKELKEAGVAEECAAMLVKEGEFLALKHPDGRVAELEDFLEPRFFDAEGVADLGPLRVKSHGGNTYSFFTADDRLEEYRLEIAGEQVPPYTKPIPVALTPVLPQPFEVVTLGTTHGFDPGGPCSNMVVQANGRFLLVDCGPYIRTVLRSAGIGLNQICAVVVTHAHEDHAVGLSALLDLNRRIRLFTSRETAAILRAKLAVLNPAVTNPERLLDDAFEVVVVEPGRDVDFLGLTLRFHYTMHSIPCTGLTVSMRDGTVERQALIVGDNNSRANIEKAAKAGVIGPERLAMLNALYDWRGDLVIADAGAGPIHGMPADFGSNGSANVVYVHTPALKAEERHRYTLAEPGHHYTLVPENNHPTPLERGIATKALMEAFATFDPDWINTMLDSASALSVNRGHLVVRQHDRTEDLFVVLTGELEVLVEEKGAADPVAIIQAGEVFGEMAVIRESARTATVRAATPARLVRIQGEVFRRFARAAGLVPVLPEVWRKRAELERIPVFASTSVTTRNRLARHAVAQVIPPGSTLIRQGSPSTTVYVLVHGRVQVYRGSEPLLVNGAPVIVDPGSLIGETAPFLKKARNASIVTIDECELLAIRGSDFKDIVQGSPQLFCTISQIVKRRAA